MEDIVIKVNYDNLETKKQVFITVDCVIPLTYSGHSFFTSQIISNRIAERIVAQDPAAVQEFIDYIIKKDIGEIRDENYIGKNLDTTNSGIREVIESVTIHTPFIREYPDTVEVDGLKSVILNARVEVRFKQLKRKIHYVMKTGRLGVTHICFTEYGEGIGSVVRPFWVSITEAPRSSKATYKIKIPWREDMNDIVMKNLYEKGRKKRLRLASYPH